VDNELREVAAEAMQLWQRGEQQQAVERVRPLADQGDLTALALICWFFHQMAEPQWRQGVPYMQKALKQGMPWVLNYFLGNMLNDAALRRQLPEAFEAALAYGSQTDPIGHAAQAFQQGDLDTGVAMLGTAAAPSLLPQHWPSFISRAEGHLAQLTTAARNVSRRRDEAIRSIEADESQVADHETALRTRTQQLVQLIEQTTNAQVQDFFDKEATTYEREAKRLWKRGVLVLSAAAAVAILPIVIYYVGKILGKQPFGNDSMVTAHFAPAVALGALAGVLLARARGRDQARQRAQDLSVALGTMFVYSAQIADEAERQNFVRDMGRTVIESFLRADSPASERDGTSLLAALTKAK
jgi:hypothetical protein